MTLLHPPLDFEVTSSLVATVPPEHRGQDRADVRLLVGSLGTHRVAHHRFGDILGYLRPGDVLVVNNSATIPSAIDAVTSEGMRLVVHVSSPTPTGFWTVEVRDPLPGDGTAPGPDLAPQVLRLAGGATLELLARSRRTPRLWLAASDGLPGAMGRHGRAIRYTPGPRYPIETYQTVFASVPGSAEMPSAGRPFTRELVTSAISGGVVVAPITLHAGVSSFEDHESPGEERYRVPASTAAAINALRSTGGRVVAVGTTVVRALETVTDEAGSVHPGEGTTDLVLGAERGLRATDGLITGWHEPRSSHLRLLEALTGHDFLEKVYEVAVEHGYLWHEFGDSALFLP